MFKILGIFLIVISACSSLVAQRLLSLTEAIELGLSSNFDIEVENLNREIAKNNNNWAEAGRFPSVTINIAQDNTISDNNNPAAFLQGRTLSNSLNPQVIARWMLFNGFAVNINKNRLEALEKQSEGFSSIVVENTVQAIILGYYNVLVEQEKLQVLKDVLKLSKDRFEYVQTKVSMGSAITFDALQAKTAYLSDSSIFVIQDLNHKNSVRNLNLIMAQDIESTYTFTDSLSPILNDYDFDELYTRMSSSNSNLKTQYINQELLRLDVSESNTALYPRLDLSLGASYNTNRADLSNAKFLTGESGPGNVKSSTINYFANFTISYNLFDGGRVKRQINNSRIRERIGSIQTNELKLSLRNDLLINYEFYQLRKNLYSISEENLKASQLNLQIAEDKFKGGTINSFDFRNVQIEYLNVALSNLEAVYNLIDSNTTLLRLTGGILSN